MKLPSLPLSLIRKTKSHVLGVDIGSHSIKIIELVASGDKVILKKMGRALVPIGAIKDGIIAEDRAALTDVLKALLDNLKPKSRLAATSIAGYSVIVKKVRVPYTDEKEIEENLDIEAENYVPFEITDVYMDFHMLRSSDAEIPRKQGTEIFLTAAKKEIVDSYAALMQDAGLTPAVVDIDAFALSNSFEGVYSVTDPVCLVDIGARKTNLNIVNHGIPLFARDISMGGAQITEAFQEAGGISFEEAEKIKMAGGPEEGIMRQFSLIVDEICNQWGQEIKKILDFHCSNSPEEDWPGRIYLSGGASLMKGLPDKISQITGLETLVFNPFQGVVFDKSIDIDYAYSIAPQMAIALGLALRDS
ncbi:type IV pilus assembly protein PilM [Dissulfurimicrobium hydrothermale]|uniref:type IV pilus assembly protein PilM n=1 Tax=Dissulfurimicrobium hydrothermale TaxID=1750598 RepID=UPI001EDB98F0|nr:type IV pilus assembly protein PilM [Dissulfurimicrobium hydrothermale]UKL13082.1 pilus assembly protein PilM [Dissulfurimicrobium hydrothermale]